MVRLVPLRDADRPMACQLLVEAQEWAPFSQFYVDPTFVLAEGIWMSALTGDELIGVVGAHNINWIDGSAELACGVVPKWRGNGAATELAKALHEYCFLDLGLRRLTSLCLEGSPMAKVAAKLGLTLEGRHKAARLKHGSYLDTLSFALMRED